MKKFSLLYVMIMLVCFPVEAKQTKWITTKINYDKIDIPEQSPKKAEIERIKKKPKGREITGDDPEYVVWFIDLLQTDSIENWQFREGFLEVEKGILGDSVPVEFEQSAIYTADDPPVYVRQKTWGEYMSPYFENATHVLFVIDRAGIGHACRVSPPSPQDILTPWAETFGTDAILPKAQGLDLIQASYRTVSAGRKASGNAWANNVLSITLTAGQLLRKLTITRSA